MLCCCIKMAQVVKGVSKQQLLDRRHDKWLIQSLAHLIQAHTHSLTFINKSFYLFILLITVFICKSSIRGVPRPPPAQSRHLTYLAPHKSKELWNLATKIPTNFDRDQQVANWIKSQPCISTSSQWMAGWLGSLSLFVNIFGFVCLFVCFGKLNNRQ